MGMDYETLDQILMGLDQAKTAEELKELFPADVVELVISQLKLVKRSEEKPYMLTRIDEN